MGGVAADPHAIEQQRQMMQAQERAMAAAEMSAIQENMAAPGMVGDQHYMMMQNANPQGQYPQGGALGALRQVKDSKKNEW